MGVVQSLTSHNEPDQNKSQSYVNYFSQRCWPWTHHPRERRLRTWHRLGLAVAMLCNAPNFSVSAPCFLTTHILICHIPVRPLAIWHHLPHDYSIAPHITGRSEFSVLNCFRCCPPYWDLPTLQEKKTTEVTERARVTEKDEYPKYLPPICR